MLGRKEHAADVTLTNPSTFALAQLAAGEMELVFNVEEDEMLIDLYAKVTYSDTAVEPVDFTLFVDGVDIATGANGLLRHTAAVIADENTVRCERTVRLDRGEHTVELRVKAPAGDVTVQGGTIPAELVAMRNSHPATLGHGVDSKAMLIQ